MRKLQTSDLFSALRLIKKAGLKEEIKPLLKMAADGGFSVEDVGIEGILCLIEAITDRKSEIAIYEVLSGPFEVDAKQVEQMDLCTLADNLQALAKENDLKRFFSLLSALNSKQ